MKAITLVRVHEQLYVADAAPVDLGLGREKVLCFVPFVPRQEGQLDLGKVFGTQGSVAVVSAPSGSAWKANRAFVKDIAGTASCVLSLVRFDQRLSFTIDEKVEATAAGGKWVVSKRCALRPEFGDPNEHGPVGAQVPNGATLTLLNNGEQLQFDVPASMPIELDGFAMYGALTPRTRQLTLSFLPEDPGRLYFGLEIPVSAYNGDQPMFGLHYFRAIRDPFGNQFQFKRIQYPLFSLPPSAGNTTLRLTASLDLREPSPGNVASAMLRSSVHLQEVVRKGIVLGDVPLNQFAPDGQRQFGTAASVRDNLEFHFATAPTRLTPGASLPLYKTVLLLPRGSIDLKSPSGALLGSSMLERVSNFERLTFNLDDPADALDAWLYDDKGRRVSKTKDTEEHPDAYLSKYAITSAALYSASKSQPTVKFSPDRLALYSLEAAAGNYRPINCGVPARLPIAPIDFDETAKSNAARNAFDSTVIARHRAGLLGDAAIFRAASNQLFAFGAREDTSATPQGFKVIDAGAFWAEIEFARGQNWRIALAFGSDAAIATELQRAFLQKEVFIVARRLPAVPPGTLTKPAFSLEFTGSNWRFRTSIESSQTMTAALAADESPLVIIKFGSSSVADLVEDSERWTSTATFIGDPADVTAVQSRLGTVIRELKEEHAAELQTTKNPDTFPGPFVDADPARRIGKLLDPNWNGVVVMSLPMLAAQQDNPFPADLQPILNSYKDRIRAAVLCADLRPAVAGSSEPSQVLALVRYLKPDDYQINDGNDPDCSGGFDLRLLKVRLRAALVERFECRLLLRLKTFFGQDFGKDGELIGSYDRRLEGGMPIDVYSFALQRTLTKTWGAGSFLESASLTRLGYERAQPQNGEPRGRFLINGSLDFNLEHVGVNGLQFDRLGIEFGAKSRSFSFNPGLLKVNVDRDKLSKLLGKLPFRLTSFIFGRIAPGKLLSLGDLGFQPLFGGSGSGAGFFSYGFTFDLDLGSLGALSKKLEGFKGELLLAWQMVSGRPELSLGFKLKGNKGGPLDFSLLDVIEVRAKQFGFGQLKNGQAYYLYAAGLQLRLLDQTFPAQGADQSIFVFYPITGGTVAFLYARVDKKDSVVPLFAVGQRVGVTGLLDSKSTLEGMGVLKKVFKDTLEPGTLPYDGSSGVTYNSKADWLLGLEARVFDVATLQLLIAEPSLYGARVTISKEHFKFLKDDWFFDLLYRRLDEDTGIFSMEIPPPVDMLDFGAVQIVLPTIRGEVGTPGSHILVDLGYPGKKSIAAWQRTGKIVTGIFGGDGGMYLGRVAPRTFPIQLTPEYSKAYRLKKDSCFTVGMAGSFGLMRYFSSGPMSGHASLTGYFMLEGALATVQSIPNIPQPNPPLAHRPPSTYLILDGQFGVKGCIEACADFKLIKAYVGLEFKVYFGFKYETWQGILFSAGVVLSAYARLVIARIKIPFDGRFEVALEFRFSFEARFELRLSNDDPRWSAVFERNSISSAPGRMLPYNLQRPAQVRAAGKLLANMTWPTPTLQALGYKSRNPIEFWLVAVPTLADRTAPSGRRVPGVVGHLIAGEHPVYVNRPNSVNVLADAMLRWMLPQVKGMSSWNGGARIGPNDLDLLDAHMAMQPGGKDSRLVEAEIPAELTGYRTDLKEKGKRLISQESDIAKRRPGLKGLTWQRLLEFYRDCLDVQVLLPKDKADKEKSGPACVPFPLPPLFELLYVVQAQDGANWKTVSELKRDLSLYQALSEREVDELQQQLDRFHALLKAERDVSGSKALTRPMQEWIFLGWHQLFCCELLRQAIDTLEVLGETTFEALRAEMVAGTQGPAFRAAQGVSRLFAGGLRFTKNGKPQGSFALAGTLFEAPQLAAGERALLCLKESPGATGWPLHASHVAACAADGLPAKSLGYEVTQLTQESDFVLPTFTLARPKGYEDIPREFPLSASATIGSDSLHTFPKELSLALLASQGLAIDWRARVRNARNELEDIKPQPLAPKPQTALRLRGICVGSDTSSFEIGLLPLALEEREVIHALAAGATADLRIGYRLASVAPETPYAELTPGNLKSLSGFRVDVSQEERPTGLALTSPLPFYAQGSQELVSLLSAWAKTGSRTCRMTVPLPPLGETPTTSSEVEVLLLANADAAGGKCGRLGNSVVGALPTGATWFAIAPEFLKRVPASPPEAVLVEARRNPMDEALVRMPTRFLGFASQEDWVPVGRLRRFRHKAAFGTSPTSRAFASDFDDFVLQTEAEASHFDLLALQVKVDGVEKIGFETSLPLMPTIPNGPQSLAYLEQQHLYQGLVPVRLLLGAAASPYALVGKRVEVLGRLRDHYGQQAPHDPVQVLCRVEEYRDEIVGPDAWEHITAFLRSSKQGVSLVLRANVRACWLERDRADFVLRRLSLIRNQFEDAGLQVSAQWKFGDMPSTSIDKVAFVKTLLGSLEKSLTVEPKGPFVEFDTPLPFPVLSKDWEVEPFAAVLRLSRTAGTTGKEPDQVREAITGLRPEGLSVKGGIDGVDELKKFFEPIAVRFAARLAVCDPALTHGSYFLINPKCISGEFLKDDNAFHAVLPFANKPVSLETSDATVVDRDLDATISTACERLDALLEEKKLGSVRDAVRSLLSLKHQLGVTCGERLRNVFTGQESPEPSRRAIEDAVSRLASECWRLASIADLVVKPQQPATTGALLKIVGDFNDPAPPGAGAPKRSLPVSTTGIDCGTNWRIPVLAWMGADPGLVPVPALIFESRHVLVDLSALKSLTLTGSGTVWLRLVDLDSAKTSFALPAFTAPAPLRRVLETPIASGHIGVAADQHPRTVEAAKLWNYSATYTVPGNGLQKGTDAVYVSVTSPQRQGSSLLARTSSPEQLLLMAADRFIAAARPTTSGAIDVKRLADAADEFAARLAGFGPLNAFGFMGAEEIAKARISHDGSTWVSKNSGTYDVTAEIPNEASIRLSVIDLDACAHPCATTSLFAKRNEELNAGFGANPSKRPVFEKFVYATPSVGFKSEVFPSLEVASMVSGGVSSTDPATWLTSLLVDLLGKSTPAQRAQLVVQCRLGFYPNSVFAHIGEANEPAAVVMLTCDAVTAPSTIPQQAGAAAKAWLAEVGGSAALGFWCADIAVFRDASSEAPERVLAMRRVRGSLPTKTAIGTKANMRESSARLRVRGRTPA